ncbi:ABC transporter permease subunit [Thalassobacillus pellis]|uniref:ABC transporter permease subunit n=1 Tax=Thalassobacillus pellis TaxID=748008 RepID=UPI001961DF37|nr:ABC transporter permease subunit [Thalassobacillus pellis]MBM7553560.1 peptide/nickel transport system permease protein [Thalassobacillus pellis]
MKAIFKQPLFWPGIIFIVVMLTASFIHMIFFDSVIPQTPFLYDSDGNLVGAPFAPFEHSILGTDSNGSHLLYFILEGAKFTILGVLAITFVSFFVAFLIGVPLGFRYKRKATIMENTFSVLYFIPASLISYIFLKPLLWMPMGGFPTSLTYRLTVEVLVISALLIPPAAILIANETSVILKKEFVTSSRVLGGRFFHVFRNHVLPHLKINFATLMTRQAIQAILVTTHLGIFQLYFGGTQLGYGLGGGPPVPTTNDWASIVGMYYDTLQLNSRWLVGVPLLFLILFILSLMGIARSIKNVMKIDKRKSALPIKEAVVEDTTGQIKPAAFQMVHRKKAQNDNS